MTRSGSDLVFLLTEKESPLEIEWPTDEEGRYVVGVELPRSPLGLDHRSRKRANPTVVRHPPKGEGDPISGPLPSGFVEPTLP